MSLASFLLELEAPLGEVFSCLLDLSEQLVIGLIAIPKGEQVPSDVDEGAAAEHDDGVEGEGKDQEEAAVVGVTQQLLSCAVTEQEDGEGTEPQKEGSHGLVQDLIDSSHLFAISFIKYYFRFV